VWLAENGAQRTIRALMQDSAALPPTVRLALTKGVSCALAVVIESIGTSPGHVLLHRQDARDASACAMAILAMISLHGQDARGTHSCTLAMLAMIPLHRQDARDASACATAIWPGTGNRQKCPPHRYP